MAFYVNVLEWNTNQVCEWLKGLDNSVLPYVHSFMNHNVNGQQLLNLRPEDLEQLGLFKLGHQEIILEAVEFLRSLHYDLDTENLQQLAMRLACRAQSLHNELSRQSDLSKPVTTQNLSDVVSIIMVAKPLIRWLDRQPFNGHLKYNEMKAQLLKLSLEMATCAQRDRFVENPMDEIKTTCGEMALLADHVIQDISDPMILQPSTLDVARLKKKSGDDLGFCILPSIHGAHQVAEIKLGSAAHQCGKMEEGDEVVQVNYQTVVGWEQKNVLELIRDSPVDLCLTLKRRPRHTTVYGQIYIKPMRLPPSNKNLTRWEHNLPSPRPELLTIPDFVMPLPKHVKKVDAQKPATILSTASMLDAMTMDDSGSSAGDESDDGSECGSRSAVRLYSTKPRNLVQRRATITGASPTAKHSRVNIEKFWRELKREQSTQSFQLRDKAVSCAQGLNAPEAHQSQPSMRPQTCLGIEQRSMLGKPRKVKFQEGKDEELHSRDGLLNDDGSDGREDTNVSRCKNHHHETMDDISVGTRSNNEKLNDEVISRDRQQAADQEGESCEKSHPPLSPARESASTKERGRLDKSFSTPAYDLTESDDDFIEKKFEAALDEHHKQQLQARAAAGKSENSAKTDSRLFDSVEDLEEHGRPIVPDFPVPKVIGIGNVARKISDFERNLNNHSNEKLFEKSSSKPFGTNNPIRSNVHIQINDVDVSDHLDELEDDSGNITTDLDTDDESNFFSSDTYDTKSKMKCEVTNDSTTADRSPELSRESSDDKSESTSSYVKANSTISSDSSVDIKNLSSGIVETINSALLEKTRLIENTESNGLEKDPQHDVESTVYSIDAVNQRDEMVRALSPNIHVQKSALVENIGTKYPTSPASSSPVPLPTRPDTPRREVVLKPEVKPRTTPPEPPPRKYNVKPPPLNINVCQYQQSVNHSPRDHHTQHQERPKVPKRSSVKQDLKKNDTALEVQPKSQHPPEVHSRSDILNQDQRHKNERLETYTDFAERSTDFIDEPNTPRQPESNKTVASNSFVDPYGYTEIPGNPASPSKSLIATSSTSSHASSELGKHEYRPQNIDTADGLCYSRQQALPIENKTRSLEKDKSHEKGVVNRAMMVARSMGLHGNAVKSSNSPRSIRKRTTNLAKRRNVAVKDISPSDLESWLIYRSRGAGGAWNKAWFVLKGASLYRFKNQDSTKAECLIALSGFTASQAPEIKSRKHSFKVYYTGTMFYFAAENEDTLVLWLDAINRATLGAERTSGLFSETDESDGENKSKTKGSTSESKPSSEKSFNSLSKMLGKKDSTSPKDSEMSAASLDRKYLKFLGSRTQNVPVPTAQFRSYRRVLPSSTPNRNEKLSSPDLQVTVASSTFYGLNASQSATDVLNSSQDMGDYRQTSERLRSNRNQRPEELQGAMTLEEFMLARQEECQNSSSNNYNNNSNPARFTPLNNDHVHVQHRNITESLSNMVQTNGMIYGSPRNEENLMALPTEQAPPTPTRSELIAASNRSFDSSESGSSSRTTDSIKSKSHKKSWEPNYLQKNKLSTNNNYEDCQAYSPTATRRDFTINQSNAVPDNHIGYLTVDYGERLKPQSRYRTVDSYNANADFSQASRRAVRNDADLTHSEENWMMETQRLEENGLRSNVDRNNPLRKAGQYQQSFKSASPLHSKDTMFEMHLEHQLQQPASPKKSKGLKNLFGKSSPKATSLDSSRESTPKKTLLGSPSLRRAFFRDKPRNRSTNQSSEDNETPQSHYVGTNQAPAYYSNISAANYISNNMLASRMHPPQRLFQCAADDTYTPQDSTRYFMPAQWPTTSDSTTSHVQHLDYPPTFEPETYTFSNLSLRRQRSTKSNENHGTCQ
ncbi:uncharacterized protein LOC106642128 isoform X3 [Copidosoma floridanum]|uniref:uncharacterized protein LOC106642128 isoform X3 n=1 Tax=Copidosoma floridanum TaxID=29053 RepID=UPI000C6F90FE|nr:uncharacterized protein LOC106642128 isoform X3 [Copidosoma floridanum]